MSRHKRNNLFQNLFRPPQKSSKAKGINKLFQNWIIRLVRSLLALIALPKSLLETITKLTQSTKLRSLSSPLGKGGTRGVKTLFPIFGGFRRLTLVLSRGRMASNRGFVLPTIAILLLIMSLVVSSLLFRSLNRTTQVIGERNQQVVYNAATPAIDRAKAKIEYLFRQDSRMPGGLPSDKDLDEILKNIKPDIQDIDPATAGVQNPYDFPDETRIDINNDGVLDNAWSFKLNTGGDGNDKTIAYSLLTRTVDDRGTTSTADDTDRTASDSIKAPRLVVRNGPINLVRSGDAACQDIYGSPDAGWDQLGAALVRRAFQVTALAIDSNNTASRTIATLEMQQDRQAERGNKWGAWFRNDLEIFPGPAFRWNGSMHTEGNLIIGGTQVNTYLISSPRSCLYTRENSEITVGGTSDETTPPFLGQIMSGSLRDNAFESGSRSNFDIYGVSGKSSTFELNPTTDSTNLVGITPNTPTTISLDPVVLFTTNQNRNRNGDVNNKTNVRDSAWKDRDLVKQGRVINKSARAPYVDDTYRADNRYGPKPQYNDRIGLNGQRIGTTIPTTDPNYATLTSLSTTIPDSQGLDGYWERRAWAEGLRVIVGQRLELGNTFGWLRANDPLYPPLANAATGSSMVNRAHEQRQWKMLRDNLAAVQSTAIYHSAGTDRDFPIACLATTAHPGTRQLDGSGNLIGGTIFNSTNFSNITVGGTARLNTDFLTGNGTDGWEFNPPATSATTFASAVANGQPLGNALRDLASFAGDPFGAFPARQDTTGSPAVPSVGADVHPLPILTVWGDYSNLRRALQQLDSENYEDLSLADKTTLQTASCTLGMLAYNIDNLQDINYASTTGTETVNRAALLALDTALQADLDGAGSQAAGAGLPTGSTPDNYINALTATNQTVARLVHLKEQVARDRRFGFGWNVSLGAATSYDLQHVNNFSYRGINYNQSTSPTATGGFVALDFNPDSDHLRALNLDPINNATKEQALIRYAINKVKYVVRYVDDFVVGGITYDKDAPTNTLVDDSAFPVRRTKLLALDFDPVIAMSSWGLGTTIDDITEEQEFIRRARSADPQYILRSTTNADFPYGGVIYNGACDLSNGDNTCSGRSKILSLGFDPTNPTNNYFGFGTPSLADEPRFIRLATSLGSQQNRFNLPQPKFPSLFYLFPVAAHNHGGTATDTALAADPSATVTQPATEPYVSNPYISNTAINGNYTYRVLQDTNSDQIENGTENGIGAIAIQPRTRGNWTTPNTTNMTGRVNRITDNGTPIATGFLDKGIFNGRESMSVRVLDLDLDLLRRNAINGETWLPYSGVIYAFREDAIREDGIARPAASAGGSCDTATEIVTATCRMDAVIANPVDPPLNTTTGISPKPVDFYADPDRRPHGFRLRKGSDLRRAPSPPPDFALRGLAFISDNSVYIQGDDSAFNLHAADTSVPNPPNSCSTNTTPIEEFCETLPPDSWSNFYTRSQLNPRFARRGDTWRPAEIIADAISILSPNFVDGSIAEGIRRLNIGATNSSYRNLNAPGTGGSAGDADRSWVRENGSVSNDVNAALPIKIARNGFPLYCVNTTGGDSGNLPNPNSCPSAPLPPGSTLREQAFGRESDALPFGFTTRPNGGTNRAYMTFEDGKALSVPPNNVRINATIVSGTVPSRGGQSYGGMHNFPRFLENWGGQNLHIAGAFIQLNFSTSATAPFDQEKRGTAVGQDGWEPNNTLTDAQRAGSSAESIRYYGAPNRRWGYDVGLQYAPAGPVASRFVTPSNTRSEFYRELPLEDPYVRRLRCATVSGVRVDPDPQLTCP
jgi:hypothetical protein